MHTTIRPAVTSSTAQKSGDLAGLIVAGLIAPADRLWRTLAEPRSEPLVEVTADGRLITDTGAIYRVRARRSPHWKPGGTGRSPGSASPPPPAPASKPCANAPTRNPPATIASPEPWPTSSAPDSCRPEPRSSAR